MSYSIVISGHTNTTDPQEAQDIEQEMLDKVTEFVDELEGVGQASFTGQFIGLQQIHPPA